jgi:hypothetical protein
MRRDDYWKRYFMQMCVVQVPQRKLSTAVLGTEGTSAINEQASTAVVAGDTFSEDPRGLLPTTHSQAESAMTVRRQSVVDSSAAAASETTAAGGAAVAIAAMSFRRASGAAGLNIDTGMQTEVLPQLAKRTSVSNIVLTGDIAAPAGTGNADDGIKDSSRSIVRAGNFNPLSPRNGVVHKGPLRCWIDFTIYYCTTSLLACLCVCSLVLELRSHDT